MTRTDLRVLCVALGFTAVVMQGGTPSKKEGACRAMEFADLIEAFCYKTVPDALDGFVSSVAVNPQGRFAEAERMADAVVEVYREKGGCLPHDLIAKGFTYEEVELHWAMAKALAHVELKMMDS